MHTYGGFLQDLGSYEITSLPGVGSYEYIYKNDELLVKVDQFGIILAQIKPPVGEALVKREMRENSSPVKVYFELEGKVHHNFDVFAADSLRITYRPEKAQYSLTFGDLEVITELFLAQKGQRFFLNTRFVNRSGKARTLKLLTCCYPYVNELLMAPWDKPEWYTRTQYLGEENAFLTTRYSVAGKPEERRYMSVAADCAFSSRELSGERLLAATRNFTSIPDAIGADTEDTLYAFSQCMAGLVQVKLDREGAFTLNQCFAMADSLETVPQTLAASRGYFAPEKAALELDALRAKYDKLFSLKKICTPEAVFDRFVNGFLPLELDWVSALDRGWPTGMRGVRDASNDFQGLIAYDAAQCRSVIGNIFATQRSDGWYPRQVPFGGSKFDMRAFVDSACFFTEFVYDYLAYTGDYSVLEQDYGYHDADTRETGLLHLMRGVEYLADPHKLGEHGLVKVQGGDWLDCLGGAGKEGIGETVMVSCQLVMSLDYVSQILKAMGREVPEMYGRTAASLRENINKAAFNDEGFYNGVFTDRREWIFSSRDPDGVKRVYVPTNAYAIISGVAEGKENAVLENIKPLRTPDGYRLFTHPFGEAYIGGIGKMGTGDFQPWFAENASVYNHGSQGFLLRALAKMGEHEMLRDVLGFLLPMDEARHPAEKICAAPYAITNCYHLVPSFYGRTGFSFLTGSVAMAERAVYQWMFGIDFDLSDLVLSPCVPESFRDAKVTVPTVQGSLDVIYHGFGSTMARVTLDGREVPLTRNGRTAAVPKAQLASRSVMEVFFC